MQISKEKLLALKITLVLCILLIFSFGILIYSNYLLAINREKMVFFDNLKIVPKQYIRSLVFGETLKNSPQSSRRKIFEKMFSNFYIQIGDKIFLKGIFENQSMKQEIKNNLSFKEVRIFSIDGEKILSHSVRNKDVTIIIGKNIGYLFDSFYRLIYLSFILGFGLLFIIYYISLKLAYITTLSVRKTNQKLKEYNHNVAHELKTPLSVIKSDLELLEFGKKLDLSIIKSSKDEILSMQNIIDSLLFLSQGDINGKLQKIKVGKEIEYIINKHFYSSQKMFILELGNESLNFNKKLFTILIKNLIENSLKYKDKNSKIVEISFINKKLIIKNSISKKMKNLNKDKLFDLFYQGDVSRSSSGYGLGLNIVKKISEIHNASVFIDIKNNFFIIKIIF